MPVTASRRLSLCPHTQRARRSAGVPLHQSVQRDRVCQSDGSGHFLDRHVGCAEHGDGDKMVVTSCVIHEVPEGQWAQNGSIRRLPEMAALAHFEHLTSIG